MQAPPSKAGIALANWNWRAVRAFVQQRFGYQFCRSTCLNYLHRLGFVLKRPKKHFLKANTELREAFVAQYAEVRREADKQGARICFVDEAHFRADVDLHAKWVLRGEPALVTTTSPRMGEKATYYSGICLETGEVDVMPVEGNTSAETTVAFLKQLREHHAGSLIVIWDNGPAHRGEALRRYLSTPDLKLRLMALPPYSPDFNADEAIWAWVREEATANTCFGTKPKVQATVNQFLAALSARTAEAKQRCRTALQSLADELDAKTASWASQVVKVDSTSVSV